MAELFPDYTEQERALSDGRIGPEIVRIDISGPCGNMDISENLEVSASTFEQVKINHILRYFFISSSSTVEVILAV